MHDSTAGSCPTGPQVKSVRIRPADTDFWQRGGRLFKVELKELTVTVTSASVTAVTTRELTLAAQYRY